MLQTRDQQRSGLSLDGVEEAVRLEKRLVSSMLSRLFKAGVSQALFNSLYPPTVRTPQFLDCESSMWPTILEAYHTHTNKNNTNNNNSSSNTNNNNNNNSTANTTTASSSPPTPTDHSESIWCKLTVTGLKDRHFEKDAFPPFVVSLVKLDGGEVHPRNSEKPMADMRVQISVINKWANVTQEVLKDVEFVRTLKDGKVVISDLVFQEISLKHGGHFTLKIEPIDYKAEVLPWKSQKIIIQSVKTHSNKKRKSKFEDGLDEQD